MRRRLFLKSLPLVASSAFGSPLNGTKWAAFTQASASNDVLSGLFSRWKMNEGSGTVVADDIGGITANMAGSPNPSWITGPNGNSALQSSGSARLDAGTLTTYSFMENTGLWTVNCWFKCTDFTSANIQTFWCTSDASAKGVLVGINRPGGTTRYKITVRTTTTVASFLDGSLSDNNWHMATFWSDGVNVGVYIDAVVTGTPVSLTGTGTGGSSQFAKFFDDGAADFFSGGLDDVRIYNRSLNSTPSDITTLFNNGAK